MALLTPLNVNCHASDGRKVRAVTSSSLAFSAPRESHQGYKNHQTGAERFYFFYFSTGKVKETGFFFGSCGPRVYLSGHKVTLLVHSNTQKHCQTARKVMTANKTFQVLFFSAFFSRLRNTQKVEILFFIFQLQQRLQINQLLRVRGANKSIPVAASWSTLSSRI